MEKYITGTSQAVWVHPESDACHGDNHCVVHNPSDHSMRAFATHWRQDKGLMERICPHGIGHPDPDDIAFKERVYGKALAAVEAIHGCDGCCTGIIGFDS